MTDYKNKTFPNILLPVIFLLSVALLLQVIFLPESDQKVSIEADPAEANIFVNVGEMYFQQEGDGLPRNQLSAEVGDIISFYNEGRVTHTVTIPKFGFDQVINPGERTALRVTRSGENLLVNCRFHIGHDARLTIVGEDLDAHDHQVTETPHPAGDKTLPIRSADDSIERLDYEVVDGVKEFHLNAEAVRWQYAGGSQPVIIESWGFNGQLPGPEIRVTEGDSVRIVFTNNLPVATTVHWHGVDLPWQFDGVPGVTQDPIAPGETFVYEFEAKPAGTRIYHTHGSHHGDEAEQLDMGLAGPLIIEPREYDRPDREYTLVLSERTRDGFFPINGRTYPNFEELRVSEGDRVRVRMINAGSTTFHPMHLHGHQFKVVAVDGNPIPPEAQLTRNNLPVLPGETYDIEFIADNPGVWMFHCHELQHAAGGMITAVVYDGFTYGEYPQQ